MDQEKLNLIAVALKATIPAFNDEKILLEMRESIKQNLQMVVDWIEQDAASCH